MAKRYDFAMNRHAKGRKKTRKDRMEGLDFQTVGVFKAESKSSAFAGDDNLRDMVSPGAGTQHDTWPELDADLAAPILPADDSRPERIGDEFGGITDRIAKVNETSLGDYGALKRTRWTAAACGTTLGRQLKLS